MRSALDSNKIPSPFPVEATETRSSSGSSKENDRARLIFETLQDAEGTVRADALPKALSGQGLENDDPRLAGSLGRLRGLQLGPSEPIPFSDFASVIRPAALLIERTLRQDLVIPDFEDFRSHITRIYTQSRSEETGRVADYIPQLQRVEPDQFGVSVCTVDGQRVVQGESDERFSVQSSSKPVTYCLAVENNGVDVVHSHIGWEPSGKSFNELTLNSEGLPHNPMINAGAIMSCSLLRPDLPIADRFDYVLRAWQRLSGGTRPGFNNPIYLSEKQTADRNFALGYFMREKGAFPEGVDLLESLDFYFQICSLEMTTRSMSVVAATLANGGVCPLTGERILSPATVQKCLSLMYSCGLYDYSGGWAFHIGLPAKSGVSGVIMVVVPNVLGLCCWSPRIDDHGNSVRGIAFCRELVGTFNFHNYDNLAGGRHGKIDPRRANGASSRNLLVDLCWAASEGDLEGIRRLVVAGAELDQSDYDGRTPLHLAASEGQVEVVDYLVQKGVDPAPVDRWGNTPLDDARRGGHDSVANKLSQFAPGLSQAQPVAHPSGTRTVGGVS